MPRRHAAGLALAATLLLLRVPAAPAQDVVLVQRVVAVTVTRAADAILVNATGTVPIAGFANPVLRARPDLVRVEGVYVLDFVATPPPRGKPVAQVETRLSATLRIEYPQAAKIRAVQVRGALGSRAVQVGAK